MRAGPPLRGRLPSNPTQCPHCNSPLPDPPGRICPQCRKTIDPAVARGRVLFVGIVVALMILVYSLGDHSHKSDAGIVDNIACVFGSSDPDCY